MKAGKVKRLMGVGVGRRMGEGIGSMWRVWKAHERRCLEGAWVEGLEGT